MQLIGFNANGNNFHFVRDLTEEELLSHKNFTMDFRALATFENGRYLWFWIGSHDEYERIIRNF